MIVGLGIALGLVGAALVTFNRPVAGQVAWLPGNTLLIIHNLAIGETGQAALLAVYLVLAVVGILRWAFKGGDKASGSTGRMITRNDLL